MLRTLLILPLCLWLTTASAVNLDSLWTVWHDKTQPDTNRMDAISDIASAYRDSQPDSAFYFAQMEFDLAKSLGNKDFMANALNIQGACLYLQGKHKQALIYYDRSLKFLEEMSKRFGMASCYNRIGIVYWKLGIYDQALEYYTRSLKIYEEMSEEEGAVACITNIGLVYQNMGNLEKALEYLTRSLKIEEKIGEERGVAYSLLNIGNLYLDMGNLEEALYCFEKGLKISEEIGEERGVAYFYINLGVLFFDQDKYTEALEMGEKALPKSEKLQSPDAIKVTSELLYDVYKKTGQPAKALEMHELYIEMRDSINSIENKEAAIKLEYQHQYEKEQALADAKHEEQMALSAEREKRQQLIAYSTGGGLVIILAFAFFIFNRLQITRRQKTIIEQQKELVEEQKKDITDSIQYAENIQRALLPDAKQLSLIPDGFVLFQPKDIVSGDFYWMQHHNNVVYLAACDCTGHGVPGAFMSMIGSSQLDEAVIEKGLRKPNEIFYEVRKGFINALKQTGEKGQQKDGMDATLIAWDKNNKLQFSVANNPLFFIRNGELLETKPDKQPVGFYTGEQKPFTHHELTLEKGDTVYIFSDGYHDQFGGPKDKKFMIKNFKKLLLSIHDKSMNEQKTILEETMSQWKGDTEQVDDILVIGVRF